MAKTALTNEMVETALADKDIRTLMRAEGLKYRKGLDEDQIESATYEALMKALTSHRPEFGQKFTTTLWRFLHWELRREWKRSRSQTGGKHWKRVEGDISEMAGCLSTGGTRVDADGSLAEDPAEREKRERLEGVLDAARRYLPKVVQSVLHQHFFDNLTVEEIGRNHGFSRETARKKLDWGLNRLRQVCAEELAETDGSGV